MKGIYILLGTNLKDRKANLNDAIENIKKISSTKVLEQSSIYETAAWGKIDQPTFYNQLLKIDTKLSPRELLKNLLLIEDSMGRVRREKWGERLIDIDILYFNELIIKESDLEIPHPGIINRRFTLVPLVEIAESVIHPVYRKSQKQLLTECTDQLGTKKII